MAETTANEQKKAPESQADALNELRGKLSAAEQARDEYLDLARQVRADFENYQKRSQRDLATERRYAQEPLARDLLPALDNLDRALEAAGKGEQGALAQLAKGVEMVRTQLLDALRRHGVTRVEAQGQPFDPNRHEAVMQQPSADHPPGTVLNVLQQGFTIHERVLRPATVVVSTQPND